MQEKIKCSTGEKEINVAGKGIYLSEGPCTSSFPTSGWLRCASLKGEINAPAKQSGEGERGASPSPHPPFPIQLDSSLQPGARARVAEGLREPGLGPWTPAPGKRARRAARWGSSQHPEDLLALPLWGARAVLFILSGLIFGDPRVGRSEAKQAAAFRPQTWHPVRPFSNHQSRPSAPSSAALPGAAALEASRGSLEASRRPPVVGSGRHAAWPWLQPRHAQSAGWGVCSRGR